MACYDSHMNDLAITHDKLLLAILWLGYFALHSLFASLTVKTYVSTRLPSLIPAYRLGFNFIATLLLIPPLWLMYQGQSQTLWTFTGIALWISHAVAVLAIAGFVYSLKFYDGQAFLGLRQLRDKTQSVTDQESLYISPLHRFVRHPWYTFALMLIWTRPMDDLLLVTAIMLTLYFFLGSRMEERKLITYHGDIYKSYKSQVPGIIPLPWKFLTAEAAQQLIHDYQATQTR